MAGTIDELRYVLNKKLEKSSNSNGIRSCVEYVTSDKNMYSILQSILEQDTHLEEVASNSFSHANGYDKIILIDSHKPEYRLRLHIWWPDVLSGTQEHVHNHSWNFCSAILTGAFRFQIFTISDKGEKMYSYLCGFPDVGTGYKMKYQGETVLRCEFEVMMKTGNIYTLTHQPLHRIMNVGRTVTSTLMLHGKFKRRTSMLYSKKIINTANYLVAKPFTKEELSQKIKRYLLCLQEASVSPYSS